MNDDAYYRTVGAAYDGIAREYDERVGQYAVSQRAKKLALQVIADLTPSGGRLLDVGCYTGIEAMALARWGFEVVGVDLSPEMAKLANEKAKKARIDSRASFYAMRASSLAELPEGARGPFDTAYSVYGTLNLEPNIEAFRRALAGLVKDGGAFVCGLLNPTVLYELVVAPWLLQFHGFRKLRRRGVMTRIGFGDRRIEANLYATGEFASLMAPEFKCESVRGLHILYPPPRGRGAGDTWWVARALDPIDRALETRAPFRSLGFFSLLVFRKA